MFGPLLAPFTIDSATTSTPGFCQSRVSVVPEDQVEAELGCPRPGVGVQRTVRGSKASGCVLAERCLCAADRLVELLLVQVGQVFMGPGVIGHRMALGDDPLDQLGMRVDQGAEHEERPFGVVSGEHVQHGGRVHRVGSVVEGEMDDAGCRRRHGVGSPVGFSSRFVGFGRVARICVVGVRRSDFTSDVVEHVGWLIGIDANRNVVE